MAANNKTASNRKKTGNNTRNNSRNYSKKKQIDPRKNEIKLFVYLAISVFLLCSNFGWCGVIGDFFANLLFGLFGTIAYVLPIYLFLSAAFLLANGAMKSIVKRVLCVGILLTVVAFVCQLIVGFDGMTWKSLYELGSVDKRGGGALLGGILVLMHKGIGLTGCVIVTVLLGIIGIIIVMDVSLIDAVKAKLEAISEEVDEDDEYGYQSTDSREKNTKVSMKAITVMEDEKAASEKASKAKKKNKIVKEEEVHELKPIKQDIAFDLPTPKVESRDFFADIE
ncbi:MAG: DNA translocase FtsK 4TM domain-containing protein, partial [Lachnospiraceae bacterium]|nr:DNA translocase FtsK 4TM domain-containing protein [Lachnospiraceae bacterium]